MELQAIDFEELSSYVDPDGFAKYLEAHRWTRIPTRRSGIAIYQYVTPEQFSQVTIPFNRAFRDYTWAMYSAVKDLAEAEHRPRKEVLLELLFGEQVKDPTLGSPSAQEASRNEE